MQSRTREWSRLLRHVDLPLLGVMIAVIGIGLVNLYSATHPRGASKFDQQLISFAIGFGLFTVFALVDYRAFIRLAYPLYALTVIALLFVWLPKLGIEKKGAHRWFGYGAARVQPSELMKIALLLALAKNLHDEPAREGRGILGLLVPLGLTALPMVIIAAQPDLSTATILFLLFMSIMVVVRLKLRSVLVLAGVTLATMVVVWFTLEPFQRDRISGFMWPDPQGLGWQADQSVIAIGAGQMFGKGFMQSSQARMKFLPEHWTDFPFAVFGEEWGFVGCVVVLALYFVLVLWALNLAAQARDRFGAVLCVGAAALFFWHVIINVGMVTRLLPVMGVTLPLVSYGGWSVFANMMALGLLMSVSIRRFGH